MLTSTDPDWGSPDRGSPQHNWGALPALQRPRVESLQVLARGALGTAGYLPLPPPPSLHRWKISKTHAVQNLLPKLLLQGGWERGARGCASEAVLVNHHECHARTAISRDTAVCSWFCSSPCWLAFSVLVEFLGNIPSEISPKRPMCAAFHQPQGSSWTLTWSA